MGGPQPHPGFQPPPQGPAYAGPDPAYAKAGADGVYPQQPGYRHTEPAPEQAAQGFNADSYGRIAEVVNDIANGEQPDVNKIVALYNGFDAQFWKGALIGHPAAHQRHGQVRRCRYPWRYHGGLQKKRYAGSGQ